MDNPQVAEYIAQLKDQDAIVRWRAADALVRIGDASAVPALLGALRDKIHNVRWTAAKALGKIGDASAASALIKALKDESQYVRANAAEALGTIGEVSSVPALIEASKDKSKLVRQRTAEALKQIGNSDTLPRKILADSRFSAQGRVNILDGLRRVRYNKGSLLFLDQDLVTLRYTFSETRALCQAVLNDEDPATREGAQAVLNWLDGGEDLLRGSQPDTTNQAQELVRAAQHRASETQPKTLLIPADEPETDLKPSHTQPTLRQRLFGKRKGVTS